MKEVSREIISRKDLVKFLAVVFSNWYFLIVIPAIALAISVLYTHRIVDVYAAKCQILLKSNDTYDYQSEIYRGLGFNSKYASYEETASQMRVLKSTSLLENVMDRMSLGVSYYIVGRLKVSEVYKHMPFKVVADHRSESYLGATFEVQVIDTSSYFLKYSHGGKEFSSQIQFGELILDNGLYLKIVRQPNLTAISMSSLSKIDYSFKVHARQNLIAKYQSAINVKNFDYTSIVEVTLNDEISARAVEVLDTLADIYVQSTLQNKRVVNENTLNYIDIQLNEVTGIINEIENELENYKEDARILNLSREEETYFNRLISMDGQLRSFKDQVKALEDLTSYLLKDEKEIKSWLPPNLFVANTDPELAVQVKELYGLRANYAAMFDSKTESNPKVEVLLSKINYLKKDLIRYIESQKEAVQLAMSELVKEIDLVEGRIKDIPKSQRQIINIERRLAVNEELYSFLLSKRAETIIARAGIVPQTKVIEKSRSIGIIYPNKTKMDLLSVLVGFALAILIILIKEMFFQKIKSLGQLQTITHVPILGSIPRQKDFSKTSRMLSGAEKSETAQSFRMLRTSLEYLVPIKKSSKTILISSLLPGEGKTFIAVNMASVLAIANRKVLLLDFDLHKPRLAKAMELNNEKGVSSILVGQSLPGEVIQNSSIESLDVITSGPVPPNASELILNENLESLIKYAEENYDYVVFDTPPISLITDAEVLMRYSDVKLFVLNSRSTSRTSIDYLERLIEKNKIENVALILNEEVISKVDYYYSRYGYGGYGYGGYRQYSESDT